MNSRETILANLRRNRPEGTPLPPSDTFEGITYADPVQQFVAVMSQVGGAAVVLSDGDDLNALIRSLYPDARTIASNLPEITLATLNPDDVATPHELSGTDLAIVRGELAVAENGCVWIPPNVRLKALYFISEYLVIIVDRRHVVHNMHQAYRRLTMSDYGFGTFISGPSKTADIEQALVVGAHGARGVTVLLV
jgi:L-lactate dehydrogenase complex protein LldG